MPSEPEPGAPTSYKDGHIDKSEMARTLLFQTIDFRREALKALLTQSRLCTLDAGKPLLLERESGTFVYVMRSGYVAVEIATPLPIEKHKYFLAWRGPHALLGETEALRHVVNGVGLVELFEKNYPKNKLGLAATFEVGFQPKVTATDPCELIEIPLQAFKYALESEPKLYLNVLVLLMNKMACERRRTETIHFSVQTSVPRVARLLEVLVSERGFIGERGFIPGERNILHGSLHVEHIAGYAGIKHDSASDALVKLARNKIIEIWEDRSRAAYKPAADKPPLNPGQIEIISPKKLVMAYINPKHLIY